MTKYEEMSRDLDNLESWWSGLRAMYGPGVEPSWDVEGRLNIEVEHFLALQRHGCVVEALEVKLVGYFDGLEPMSRLVMNLTLRSEGSVQRADTALLWEVLQPGKGGQITFVPPTSKGWDDDPLED